MTAPGAGRLLRADLGEDANVFVRGVFHILDGPARRKAADAVAALVGARGVALLAETNHRGPRLEYLERLGAGPRGIPPALARVIAAGTEVKKRDGISIVVTRIPKLAMTLSTADVPTIAIRDTWQSRRNVSRASLVSRAVPVMSTSSGRLWSPFSSLTVAIASAASGPVMCTPGVQRSRTTPASTCNQNPRSRSAEPVTARSPNRSSAGSVDGRTTGAPPWSHPRSG